MRGKWSFALLAAILMIALLQGCAKYKVTQSLSEPLDRGKLCLIGDITESLPGDMEEEDKPPLGDIEQFKSYLQEELQKKDFFQDFGDPAAGAYEVTGNILAYKRGSGAVRFLIGFGIGNAKITIELKLHDAETREIVFAGNFKQTVSSGIESGITMYKNVAKDFAKELGKQLKRLEKERG